MNSSSVAGVQNLNAIAVADISPPEIGVTSLDDRFRDAFASVAVETEAKYNDIMTKSNDPMLTSEPGGLFALQVMVGDYKLQMETISALTRKGVAVAETLLRA